MRIMPSVRLILSMLATWFLIAGGCVPVISPEALQTVDRSLTFQELQQNPDRYKGKTVLAGGSIIATRNLDEKTIITILHYPLDSNKKPGTDGKSEGRFLISVPGFIDPAIYRSERLITVVGTVSGHETRLLGEREYRYPVIEQQEMYLWPLKTSDGTPGIRIGIGIGL